jgi:ABC-type lipoprotein release transport system permease subunit
MTRSQLITRGLTFYWRTHLAVVLGVATAVAVLAGALLVGDSVRGSLRGLALSRLGATGQVVASAALFRESLADLIGTSPQFAGNPRGIVPLLIARGIVTNQESGRRVGQVAVYGVDDRFWDFHGVEVDGPADRQAYLSPSLAEQLVAGDEVAILVRVQRPTDVPLESLHGRKDDLSRTLRLTSAGVLPRELIGEFALEPQQGEVRAVFVPLSRLQQELDSAERVNALLVASDLDLDVAALEALVRAHANLDDFSLTLTEVPSRRTLVLGSTAGLIDDRFAEAARNVLDAAGYDGEPVYTYLANTLRIGNREIPYSLVTAVDLSFTGVDAASRAANAGAADPPIVLTQWAADDLGARVDDPLTLEYYVWQEPGQLLTREATFRVAAVVPLAVGHRDLAPSYPGISDSPTLDDWDPPFAVDLRRVRPVDERFWEEHRTTPKAFVPLETGQQLWRSRYGAVTSFQIVPPEGVALEDARRTLAEGLRQRIDPLDGALAVRDVRDASLAASRGATDFGEYFIYFSFFLVVSALLLAALFFKLGVEQRVREVGLLRAVGFGPRDVRRLFLAEGLLLSVAGSLLGLAGAIGYASLLMYALRTWWVDAVGTRDLTLHVTTTSLVAGAVGGIVAALVCIWWTLRSLDRISERSLLAGTITSGGNGDGGLGGAHARTVRSLGALAVTLALAVAGALLIGAGAWGLIQPAGAFFGAAFALLASTLGAFLLVLRRRPVHGLASHGWKPLSQLGWRNASYRPGRSVLSMAVIAAATFILVSVDAFRRDSHAFESDPRSGLGGYLFVVDTIVPIAHDPNTREGRESLNLFALDEDVRFEPFRLLPGEDASCLNLYAPRNPRILAPRDTFLEEGRFSFASSLAETEEERANPWLLLRKPQPDGAVPVIGDANSMTYVLHREVGDEMVVDHAGQPVRLRFVAALRDSIFQSELLMSDGHFRRLFPQQEGYQFLLAEADAAALDAVMVDVEDGLSDFGADAVSTAERLAQYHRVENTYLTTFQTLGGLGLLLGTVGLATVLLRNVLERRRELALLGAVGYRRRHFLTIVVAENTVLLAGGLLAGAACAVIAVLPAVAERGGRLPLGAGVLLLLFAVLVTGLLSSVVATRAATRAPLLSSLRSE